MAWIEGRVTNPRKRKSKSSSKARKSTARKRAHNPARKHTASRGRKHASSRRTHARRRRNPSSGGRFNIMNTVVHTVAAAAGGVATRFVVDLYDEHVTDRFGLDPTVAAIGKFGIAAGAVFLGSKFGKKAGKFAHAVDPFVYGMVGVIGSEVYDDFMEPEAGMLVETVPAAVAGMGFNNGSLFDGRNGAMQGLVPSGASMNGLYLTNDMISPVPVPNHYHMQGEPSRML